MRCCYQLLSETLTASYSQGGPDLWWQSRVPVFICSRSQQRIFVYSGTHADCKNKDIGKLKTKHSTDSSSYSLSRHSSDSSLCRLVSPAWPSPPPPPARRNAQLSLTWPLPGLAWAAQYTKTIIMKSRKATSPILLKEGSMQSYVFKKRIFWSFYLIGHFCQGYYPWFLLRIVAAEHLKKSPPIPSRQKYVNQVTWLYRNTYLDCCW